MIAGNYDEVLLASKIFGGLFVRLDILRLSISLEEFTISDVVTHLEISRPTARMHLLSLQELGVLASRRARQPRGAGSIRYWTAHTEIVAEAIDTLSHYVLDGAGSTRR